MWKFLANIFAVIITSCFLFPFFPTFMPMVNTKMALAAVGLVILGKNRAESRDAVVNRQVFVMTLYALLVGVISLFSETYHGTGGNIYVTLFVSMWVWIGAAYTVSQFIKWIHGEVTVQLFFNYVILVCVFQCIIAVTKEYYSPLKMLVDNLVSGEGFMGKAGSRLYGIGAALDVAGLRFSAVLVIITYLCVNLKVSERRWKLIWYLIAYFIIVLLGNMMSRSTTIGFIISMAYLGYAIFFKKEQKENAIAFGKYFLIILTVILPVLMTLYYADDTFYKNIRFAFEGFFNWWEQGEYKNRSNSILLHMIVWPDNWQDWLLGEGYFAQPNLVDPYYIGPRYEGFYKGTDIGYCLFIFYFGLIGLACMIAYIVKAAFCGMERFPMYKGMFFMILAINLIGWCKVSTDIFPIFAPFLIIPAVSIQKNELN